MFLFWFWVDFGVFILEVLGSGGFVVVVVAAGCV